MKPETETNLLAFDIVFEDANFQGNMTLPKGQYKVPETNQNFQMLR